MDEQAMISALPSWREGATRRAIVGFLLEVTQGRRAVPAEERLAAFDNDGTLACEKPHTALAQFLATEAAARGVQVAHGIGGHAVLAALGELFEGCGVLEYEQQARAFLEQARHPRFGRGYPQLVYAPMRELIALLHDLDFSVFLCSDSSRDFNRVLAGAAYGLPRQQVIGSEVRIELRDGQLIRTATPEPLDDGAGKTVHLWDHTGRLPLLAAGNAAGDIEMLTAARFAILIRHDDAEREYDYQDEELLATAARGGWTVVSVREDFDRLWDDHPVRAPR